MKLLAISFLCLIGILSCTSYNVVPHEESSYYPSDSKAKSSFKAVDGPPAEPGKCYAKCLIEDRFITQIDSIVHYKNINEIERDTVRVTISPNSQTWIKKVADKNCISSDPNDCMVWCLEKVKAKYVYKLIPRNTEEAVIDSVQQIEIKKLVKEGGYTEWKDVVCSKDLDSLLIHKIQAALNTKGYNSETFTDNLNSQTKISIAHYQKENGLPIGQLDFETLKSLGVDY